MIGIAYSDWQQGSRISFSLSPHLPLENLVTGDTRDGACVSLYAKQCPTHSSVVFLPDALDYKENKKQGRDLLLLFCLLRLGIVPEPSTLVVGWAKHLSRVVTFGKNEKQQGHLVLFLVFSTLQHE